MGSAHGSEQRSGECERPTISSTGTLRLKPDPALPVSVSMMRSLANLGSTIELKASETTGPMSKRSRIRREFMLSSISFEDGAAALNEKRER